MPDLKQNSFPQQQMQKVFLLKQNDHEILSLNTEISFLYSTINPKNEDVDTLMRSCGEMQRSLDKKV